MVGQNPILPTAGPNPKIVTAITINKPQYPPGIWPVTLTYSDGSTANMGLSTVNVQYWIDYTNGAFTDLTLSFVRNTGSAVVTTSTKAVSLPISDNLGLGGN